MANDRPATPMIEAFLRQAEAPPGTFIPEAVDWPIAILIFFGVSSIHKGEGFDLLGIVAAIIAFRLIRYMRATAVSRKEPRVRLAYERWKRISRLKKIAKDGSLGKSVPEPVMLALERTARTWHEAREGTHTMEITDPDTAAEIQRILDTSMSVAVATAEPVVRTDKQSKKDVLRMAQDKDLMTRVCTRIDIEDARMKTFSIESQDLGLPGSESLRDRMERARQERALAEAELDALI